MGLINSIGICASSADCLNKLKRCFTCGATKIMSQSFSWITESASPLPTAELVRAIPFFSASLSSAFSTIALDLIDISSFNYFSKVLFEIINSVGIMNCAICLELIFRTEAIFSDYNWFSIAVINFI